MRVSDYLPLLATIAACVAFASVLAVLVIRASAIKRFCAARAVTRRLLASASVVSLLLCVVVAGLWARSYWRFDNACYRGDDWSAVAFSSNYGGLSVAIQHMIGLGGYATPGWECFSGRAHHGDGPPVNWSFLGFSSSSLAVPGISALVPPYTMTYEEFTAPYWFMLVLCVWLCWRATQLAGWRRPRPKGLCAVCGYDLRASPERCPECGTPVPTPEAKV